MDESINRIRRTLKRNTKDPVYTEQTTKIIETITNQNYFKFNDKIYKQGAGLGMGNPTSAILTEVFMQNLEQKYMEHLKNELGIILYIRYADDILCIMTKNNEKEILTFLNKQHKNIQFTMELEHENTINYLDLTISKNHDTNQLTFEIYRKPTATDTIIHATSNHPQQHKIAAIRHLITRLEHTPLTKKGYNQELNTIYNIATNNGYTIATVNKILQKTKTQTNKDKKSNIDPWATFTYIGKQTYKITNFFKKYGINIALKTKNNVGTILRQNINTEDQLEKQGVYKLTCTCQYSYIGQTGRKFKTRFREHIKAYNKKTINNRNQTTTTQDSNFANHMLNNNCKPTHIKKTLSVLHTQTKGRRLNTLENMEIYKQKTFDGRIINEQINTTSDILFEPLKLIYKKHKTPLQNGKETKTKHSTKIKNRKLTTKEKDNSQSPTCTYNQLKKRK